jgi:hypothetical protein
VFCIAHVKCTQGPTIRCTIFKQARWSHDLARRDPNHCTRSRPPSFVLALVTTPCIAFSLFAVQFGKAHAYYRSSYSSPAFDRPALGDIRKRRAVYRYTTLYCTLLHSTALNNTYAALRFLIAQGRPFDFKGFKY